MTEPTRPAWERPGYAEITSAAPTEDGSRVTVEFGNGDNVVVAASTFGATGDLTSARPGAAGMSIELTTDTTVTTEVSWEQIRAAVEPDFADELRRRDLDEARRVGRRLRALREDRGLPQADVAKRAGMTAPQLSKIESGTYDLRVSTVRSLLRVMNAAWADIGPDAPEQSRRSLRRDALKAGVPSDVFDRLAAAIGRTGLAAAIGNAFDWSPTQLASGQVSSAVPVPVAFKTTRPEAALVSPMLALSYKLARVVTAALAPRADADVPADPARIRATLPHDRRTPRLETLTAWSWNVGVPVLPVIGGGSFAAAALRVDTQPVVILKETRELEAFWLFDLAHELGHIALGHSGRESVIDVDSPTARHENSDREEREANRFALELLLPDHIDLIAAVRRETRGNYLRFKGAVESVAGQARVGVGLLGMVAAFELHDIGEPKDRWGSATNLARQEGDGRTPVVSVLRTHLTLDALDPSDRMLIDTFVLGESPTPSP